MKLASNDSLRQCRRSCWCSSMRPRGRTFPPFRIIASTASALCKLASDLIRCLCLTGVQWEVVCRDQWGVVCRGILNDFDFSNSDLTVTTVCFLSAIPSWRLGKFITDSTKRFRTALCTTIRPSDTQHWKRSGACSLATISSIFASRALPCCTLCSGRSPKVCCIQPTPLPESSSRVRAFCSWS